MPQTSGEVERERKLREDPMAVIVNGTYIDCKRCGRRIKLSSKMAFDPLHWINHRARCLRRGKQKQPSASRDEHDSPAALLTKLPPSQRPSSSAASSPLSETFSLSPSPASSRKRRSYTIERSPSPLPTRPRQRGPAPAEPISSSRESSLSPPPSTPRSQRGSPCPLANASPSSPSSTDKPHLDNVQISSASPHSSVSTLPPSPGSRSDPLEIAGSSVADGPIVYFRPRPYRPPTRATGVLGPSDSWQSWKWSHLRGPDFEATALQFFSNRARSQHYHKSDTFSVESDEAREHHEAAVSLSLLSRSN